MKDHIIKQTHEGRYLHGIYEELLKAGTPAVRFRNVACGALGVKKDSAFTENGGRSREKDRYKLFTSICSEGNPSKIERQRRLPS